MQFPFIKSKKFQLSASLTGALGKVLEIGIKAHIYIYMYVCIHMYVYMCVYKYIYICVT